MDDGCRNLINATYRLHACMAGRCLVVSAVVSVRIAQRKFSDGKQVLGTVHYSTGLSWVTDNQVWKVLLRLSALGDYNRESTAAIIFLGSPLNLPFVLWFENRAITILINISVFQHPVKPGKKYFSRPLLLDLYCSTNVGSKIKMGR